MMRHATLSGQAIVKTSARIRGDGAVTSSLRDDPITTKVQSKLRQRTDTEAVYLELRQARAVARGWADTIHELHRTDRAALFARMALSSYAAIVAPTLT